MILFKQIELLQRTHKLIDVAHTGTPEDFAKRLGISSRRLYDVLDEMKMLGAPITYSRKANTYYYTDDFEVKIFCQFQCLSQKELTDTAGGFVLFKSFLFPAFFVR
jgi:predicted DNA-binding transcriptional regulator YafY